MREVWAHDVAQRGNFRTGPVFEDRVGALKPRRRGFALIATLPALVALGAALVGGSPASAPASAANERSAGKPAGAEQEFAGGELVVGLRGGREAVVELPPRLGVAAGRKLFEALDGVGYANRNWVTSTADHVQPHDRGYSTEDGGWRRAQWNFVGGPGAVRALPAWHQLAIEEADGAAGVKIAVVDTGVAFEDSSLGLGFAASPGFRGSPPSTSTDFDEGRNFVGGGPPIDRNGHGTHIAGTIAEHVTLAEGDRPDDFLTGLAYAATVMPVRVLDRNGVGTSSDLARGIRWAANNGADVINVSVQLSGRVRRCAQVRMVCRAVRHAREQGALVVAAAGNTAGGGGPVRFPAATPGVLAVGASTQSGCLAAYSHHGRRVDLIAPGGGRPMAAVRKPRCVGDSAPVRQVSFECYARGGGCSTPTAGPDRFRTFAIRPSTGTSMAAAHASAVAAMTRAAFVGRAPAWDPPPHRLRNRLRCSARPLGQRRFHGTGLLDARRSTLPQAPPRCRA